MTAHLSAATSSASLLTELARALPLRPFTADARSPSDTISSPSSFWSSSPSRSSSARLRFRGLRLLAEDEAPDVLPLPARLRPAPPPRAFALALDELAPVPEEGCPLPTAAEDEDDVEAAADAATGFARSLRGFLVARKSTKSGGGTTLGRRVAAMGPEVMRLMGGGVTLPLDSSDSSAAALSTTDGGGSAGAVFEEDAERE